LVGCWNLPTPGNQERGEVRGVSFFGGRDLNESGVRKDIRGKRWGARLDRKGGDEELSRDSLQGLRARWVMRSGKCRDHMG